MISMLTMFSFKSRIMGLLLIMFALVTSIFFKLEFGLINLSVLIVYCLTLIGEENNYKVSLVVGFAIALVGISSYMLDITGSFYGVTKIIFDWVYIMLLVTVFQIAYNKHDKKD